MDECSVMTPVGCVGNRGVEQASFHGVMAREEIHAIATDAGSADCGPWYLGAGSAHSPLRNIRWDLDHFLSEAIPRRVPLIIGSAGGSGARPNVDATRALIEELARQRDLHFRITTIYADVEQDWLLRREEPSGGIAGTRSLDDASLLSADALRHSRAIVALMGVDPILAALDDGADVVLCGRAVDAAVVAAYPIWKGFQPGLSYHMGDIMECGESAAEELRPVLKDMPHNRIPIVGHMFEDHFTLTPAHEDLACTPVSTLMHSFYERTDVENLFVPGGVVGKAGVAIEAVDERTTRISGTTFEPRPHSLLLEGVRQIGFRSVFIFGVRSDAMIRHLRTILEEVEAIEQAVFGDAVRVIWHTYGMGGVLGAFEFERDPAYEVGVVADVLAPTQELAHDVATDLITRVSFWRFPGRHTTAGNVAVALSPGVLDGGEVFEFSIYHTFEDPAKELPFRTETATI